MVKCVVWDLDNTLWHGILLEDGDVAVRDDAMDVVRELDSRGILQSVASRNDHETAMARLAEAGLDTYFLVPQIGWQAKSASIGAIAEALGIGLDTFLFVDDDTFEREEVSSALPQVRVTEPIDLAALLRRPDLSPATVTVDGARRRQMYQAEQARIAAEAEFTGPAEHFLSTLGMRVTVRLADEKDLGRAEELTVRTHQLNATGYTYGYEELRELSTSPYHLLAVAELTDRFGDYGTIGLVLIERTADTWTLKLLLASCRVMSRGIGTVLLNHVIERAQAAGVRLFGDFVPTDRNRMMRLAYRFAGFAQVEERDGVVVLERRPSEAAPVPAYITLNSEL